MITREKVLENTINLCRERNILIPTYKQMRNPDLIPKKVKEELKDIGLWDVNPRNLFRITWKNEPVDSGGGFGNVNYLEIPKELTGVKARIFILLGKFFPTGTHKVGATFGPLVQRLITGEFDPTHQKALWPSTGNYCRGGSFNSALLGCVSVSVLPEKMSKERFEWLENIGSEVHRTPGSESNVKEIYDKTKELKEKHGDDIVVLNQFEEIANPLWHYTITASAMAEVFEQNKTEESRFSGLFLTQGSAGTLGAGDFLREKFPLIKIAAGEALQCPTLLYNGYGSHRIEGIGDKHVPWIHNMKNMDMVIGIDDEIAIRLMQLFNEPTGVAFLKDNGVPPEIADRLYLLGISGIANLAGAIKMAKYYEFNEKDMVFTVGTDSMEMYGSRLAEEREKYGEYSVQKAAIDFEARLMGLDSEGVMELSYYDKKRMHNLKYFTWVEQQGKTVEELDAQWYDDNYWKNAYSQVDAWDEKITEFNEKTGLLKKYE
ncbi:MAG TPA: pyridoxal-phosphate dependent enzyme [Candidatus Marinimicrobia bacterium]|nr:pyridoxal-phosphate dependent enzyme [Candidatus Neomarinimicrobiota bacterium]